MMKQNIIINNNKKRKEDKTNKQTEEKEPKKYIYTQRHTCVHTQESHKSTKLDMMIYTQRNCKVKHKQCLDTTL